MRLPYDPRSIALIRGEAEAFGHHLAGRFTRVPNGLSWEHHCSECRAYVVVTPPWAPWDGWTFDGPAVRDFCTPH